MRLAFAIAAMLLLTGWSGCQVRKPLPVDAHCDLICLSPCVTASGDVGVRWEADPTKPEAWDSLGENTTTELATKLRQCDVKVRACQQCLKRLADEKVIFLP